MLALFVLLQLPLLATDAVWLGTTDNLATQGNWEGGQIPDGTAIFDSSSAQHTALVWDPANANPPPGVNQFYLAGFNFSKSASVFSFTFTGNDCPYGLAFNGAGLTGRNTNTSLIFDNTNSMSDMTFPQLLFAPNGSSNLGSANVTATNGKVMIDPNYSNIRNSVAQVLFDGSANAIDTAGANNQCAITGCQNQMTLINNGTITIGGGADFQPDITRAIGQFVMDGSSNAVSTGSPATAGNGAVSFTTDGSSFTLSNNGSISSSQGKNYINGSTGQWIVDGSSNAACTPSTASAGTGSASFNAYNSTFLLRNGNTIQGNNGNSNYLIRAFGQLVVDGSSSGVGDLYGGSEGCTATGGPGNASFAIENSSMTFENLSGSLIQMAQMSDMAASAGQLVISGSSNGFAPTDTVYGIGTTGSASFISDTSSLNFTNNGSILAGYFHNTIAPAAQLVIDGSSNADGNPSLEESQAMGESGNASFTLNKSTLTLMNDSTGAILGGIGTNAIVGPVGQMVINGSSNQKYASSTGGNGNAFLTTEKSTIAISNKGSIHAQSSGALAGQLVFDGSVNLIGQNCTDCAGLAVLNAGDCVNIYVTNESTGTITTMDTLPAQVYFHNAQIQGSPLISVANYNASANIEGILFDQESTGGSAILTLENTSLYVNTTTPAPLSIGGLNGNTASTVKLIGNSLQIATLPGATTSFDGSIIGGNFDLLIAGLGTQILDGTDSSAGSVQVNGGTLVLNGTVNNNVFANDGGTITGTGNIGKDLIFSNGATYLAQLSGTPFATTCLHAAGALAPNGTLKVVSTNGTYAIGQPYTILTGGTLNPTKFTSIVSSSPWLVVTPIYNPDPSVDIILSTNFAAGADSRNQLNVANQIDTIVMPQGKFSVLINQLLNLNANQLPNALEMMAGEQYAYLLQLNQMSDRRFSGRIFEAVRDATRPCCCRLACQGSRVWASAEGGQFHNNGRAHVKGFRNSFFDISLGAQKAFNSCLLAGVAANFAANWLDFSVGGRDVLYAEQGGVYALWNNDKFYLFTDFIGGGSQIHLKRPIQVGGLNYHARSNPVFYHGAWYGEAGIDFKCASWLLQPFFGVDVTYVSANGITETGADLLNLAICSHHTTCPDIYLGAHWTACNSCIDLSADLLWRHRCGSLGTNIQTRFLDLGTPFIVQGCDSGRDSLIGRVRASQVFNSFLVYGEAAGEVSLNKAFQSNWSLQVGIQRAL